MQHPILSNLTALNSEAQLLIAARAIHCLFPHSYCLMRIKFNFLTASAVRFSGEDSSSPLFPFWDRAIRIQFKGSDLLCTYRFIPPTAILMMDSDWKKKKRRRHVTVLVLLELLCVPLKLEKVKRIRGWGLKEREATATDRCGCLLGDE